MRVLFCTPYTRFDCGIAQWARHLIGYHKEHNDNVEWDLISFDRKTDYVEGMSSIKRAFRGIVEYWPKIKQFRKCIKHSKYDVVHICTSAGFGIYPCYLMLRMAKAVGIPTVVHFHFGRIPVLLEAGGWEANMCLRVCREATISVPIDMASCNALKQKEIRNAVYLPNPMSPEVNNIIKENPNIERKKNHLLFVGHMFVTKGIFELVKAVKQVPEVSLRMIGAYEPGVKKSLDELIGDDKERIEIAGTMSHAGVIKEMMACDIFILPTYSEGFPGVILESMGCGCPIIASGVGAIPQMLETDEKGDYGIIIRPKNVDDIVSGIKTFLASDSYKIECGKNAQRRVNELYSVEVVWKELKKIWAKAANNNKGLEPR
jgi:glycosyltransferase involved in cell wall biosynthesis